MARDLSDRELPSLNEEIMKMAEIAHLAFDKAIESFVKLDTDLAEEVIGYDKQLYDIQLDIENTCFELIARYQPLARDLRTLSTYLYVVRSLYRVGRYSMDIAVQTRRMVGLGHYKKIVTIPEMARLTHNMISNSIEGLMKADTSLVENLSEEDDQVDALFEEILREIMTYVMQDGKLIPQSISYLLVARYLERLADHACYIGERVLYMVTGERRMIR
jgi:phosphate transport system protein